MLNILSRFGGMSRDLSWAKHMTLDEYYLRLEAYALQQEDQRRAIHEQAWANQVVKNTKGEGDNVKPLFQTFDQFYDSEKVRNEIRSTFEPNYRPVKNKPAVRKKTAGELRIARMIKYEEMMKNKKA